jgi:hypothetical protein
MEIAPRVGSKAANSGKIGGAFLGHARRHGRLYIDRMEMRFSGG